jgi:hypothetical protein
VDRRKLKRTARAISFFGLLVAVSNRFRNMSFSAVVLALWTVPVRDIEVQIGACVTVENHPLVPSMCVTDLVVHVRTLAGEISD